MVENEGPALGLLLEVPPAEELEALLRDPEVTGDERKKIRKKLQKRKKQKEQKGGEAAAAPDR